jgi:hypothetical protein
MKRASRAFRINKRLAEHSWGQLSSHLVTSLRSLTSEFSLSVGRGDIICLDGHWYVTHSGLLRLASRRRCVGIQVEMVRDFCDPTGARWAFRATVFPSDKSTGFVGFGDADPSNVSSVVRGAEMRVAETRAVNRALRKAYGIGICSAEEIGTIPISTLTEKPPPGKANGSSNGTGPKVRDRLCQIIRQHQLNPELVKAYAVDFCGTQTLRKASREQVENFVQQLADRANRDRNGLLGKLNTYTHPKQEGAI